MTPADLETLADARTAARAGSARLLRQRAGLRLAEIGSACGVTAQTIHQWETGARTPTGPPALVYGRLLRRLARRTTDA